MHNHSPHSQQMRVIRSQATSSTTGLRRGHRRSQVKPSSSQSMRQNVDTVSSSPRHAVSASAVDRHRS
jgi:hypothetical protein